MAQVIAAIQWDEVAFNHNSGTKVVNLNEPFSNEKLDALNALIRDAKNFPDFMRALLE